MLPNLHLLTMDASFINLVNIHGSSLTALVPSRHFIYHGCLLKLISSSSTVAHSLTAPTSTIAPASRAIARQLSRVIVTAPLAALSVATDGAAGFRPLLGLSVSLLYPTGLLPVADADACAELAFPPIAPPQICVTAGATDGVGWPAMGVVRRLTLVLGGASGGGHDPGLELAFETG